MNTLRFWGVLPPPPTSSQLPPLEVFWVTVNVTAVLGSVLPTAMKRWMPPEPEPCCTVSNPKPLGMLIVNSGVAAMITVTGTCTAFPDEGVMVTTPVQVPGFGSVVADTLTVRLAGVVSCDGKADSQLPVQVEGCADTVKLTCCPVLNKVTTCEGGTIFVDWKENS